jgi:hypothetical protein
LSLVRRRGAIAPGGEVAGGRGLETENDLE